MGYHTPSILLFSDRVMGVSRCNCNILCNHERSVSVLPPPNQCLSVPPCGRGRDPDEWIFPDASDCRLHGHWYQPWYRSSHLLVVRCGARRQCFTVGEVSDSFAITEKTSGRLLELLGVIDRYFLIPYPFTTLIDLTLLPFFFLAERLVVISRHLNEHLNVVA